ncbi:MAG: hypothetical protein E7627_01605 [Ruminococcaceae bacterium]|nr:hypothetical protein [Oscillospiraceae bacterium]
MARRYYTVYRNEDDEIVAFGNAAECTRQLGLKDEEQFYAFVSKTKSGLRKSHSVVIDCEPEETLKRIIKDPK